MKQVTVICLEAEREAAVDHLRDLGTVHVVPSLPPASTDLDQLQRRREAVERALGLLMSRPASRAAGAAAGAAGAVGDADEATARVMSLAAEQTALADRRQKLTRAAQDLEPWGSFSRESLEACRAAGLQVVLADLPAEAVPALPPGAVLKELSRKGKTLFAAVVAPADVTLDLPAAPLPDAGDLASLAADLQDCDRRSAAVEADLDRLAAATPALKRGLEQLDEAIAFARARDGMGATAPLAYLEGYVPAADLASLLDTARRHGWAVRAIDPASDDPRVPTKLRLARWVEPVRGVFTMLGILPGYGEVDIGACFLLFFSIFFAMLIGDAGYGAIMLIATLVVRARDRQAPAAPFWLFGVLSTCTILWGVLTGTYFAIRLADDNPLRLIPSVSYFAEPRNIQFLCFLIGTVHLSIAHLWNASRTRPWLKALGSLSWIPILWGNFLLAKRMVLGVATPPVMLWLYGIGLVGVVLFSEPSRNPFKTVGMGLGKVALNLANSFVDVVSYVRLFAVGAAGMKVAESMNAMATGMSDAVPWVGGLLAAVVLILGHGFNILLSAMGVLVHGVRLNVLEFAGHVGLEFAGSAYRPLQRRRATPGTSPDAGSEVLPDTTSVG
ncbi:MAG: hypothetical protein GX595_01460 [Lentisphaerae bacterium]|nr:hypothetical protein [Lentisphaerota bacterium]